MSENTVVNGAGWISSRSDWQGDATCSALLHSASRSMSTQQIVSRKAHLLELNRCYTCRDGPYAPSTRLLRSAKSITSQARISQRRYLIADHHPYSSIHIHLLPCSPSLIRTELLHSHEPGDILPPYNFLPQHGRGTLRESIISHLLLAGIRRNEVPHECRLVLCNYRHIHIASTAQIVPDTRLDRVARELYRFLTCHFRFPLSLEYRHGR